MRYLILFSIVMGVSSATAATHLRLAQDTCQQMIDQAAECRARQESLGGGTDGQAGSFYECWKVYCQGASALPGCTARAAGVC